MNDATDALHVLSVGPSDVGGGAERVARELHLAYLERGIDSWLAVAALRGGTPNTLEIPHTASRGAWARGVLGGSTNPSRARRVLAQPVRYGRVALGHEDFDFPATSALPGLPPCRPDVMHLHNLHGAYFDIRALPGLTAAVPTIATLHDAWLLTGHCAHPIDCDHWRTGCGDCPHLDVYVPIRRDASAANFSVKLDAVSRSGLRIATPSSWLMRMVHDSPFASSLVETRVIPNGVDTDTFSAGDKLAARRRLGLPSNRLIVLSAATSIEHNPFKDFPTLIEALGALPCASDSPILVVALGSTGSDAMRTGPEVRSVPFVSDSATVADYYRAADLYVHAARAENLPLAIIEAMACGTPVVASSVGGIPEIVTDGVTGLLVPPGDATALAEAIVRALSDPHLRGALAESASDMVCERFTLTRQVDAYLDWYADILS